MIHYSEATGPELVKILTTALKNSGIPFKANDNLAGVVSSEQQKCLQIEVAARINAVMEALLIDVANDHNTRGTAARVAKMYMNEVFKGRYDAAPQLTDFPNVKNVDELILTGPITVRSACSHHLVPIVGKCWIGVIPGERVIGLSKFNRIVEWIASRPQIQEEMTVQIADFIDEKIMPKGLAVIVEATHMCMTWRGVRETMEAKMTTSVMRGAFREDANARAEFMALVTK